MSTLQATKRMSDMAVSRWLELSLPEKAYALGMALLFLGGATALLLQGRGNPVTGVLVYLGAFFFEAGFVIWCISLLKRTWFTETGAKLALAFHAFVGLISVVPARWMVSESLGLPAQDFDMTVTIVTLTIYPFVWMLAAMAIAFLIYALALMSVCIWGMASSAITPLRNALPRPKNVGADKTKPNDIAFKGISTSIGAACFALTLTIPFDFMSKQLLAHPNVVRWIAYYADFQSAASYPGVEKGKRFRLHENGIVSYAELNGWDARITVGIVANSCE